MMKRIHQRREGREGGFTLIELLIVIVILGILAAVVVFSVRGITDRGSTSACRTTMAAVQTAAEAIRAQTGTYPTNMAAIVTSGFFTLPAGVTSNDTSVGTTLGTPTGDQWVVTYATGNPPTVTGTKAGGSC